MQAQRRTQRKGRQALLERYERFLLAHGADKVRHSGRTLFDHLKGTHDLLRDWGCAEHVCVAGLFHSVYGTQHFRHETLSLEQRPLLRQLIGDQAEKLVYLFGVGDRNTFTNPDLLAIAKANAIEQRAQT